MLYKPGDRVVVREDLREDIAYYMADDPRENNYATSDMCDARGTVLTIQRIEFGEYICEEFSLRFWTDEMFSGLAEEEEPFDVEDLL